MEAYKEMKSVCDDGAPQASRATMTEQMKTTRAAADDVLCCVGRIQNHLFGAENVESCEKLNDPRCFSDDLTRTNQTIHRALNELYKICAMLGVE